MCAPSEPNANAMVRERMKILRQARIIFIGLSVFLSVSRECGGSITLQVKLDRPRVIGDVGVNERKEEKKRRVWCFKRKITEASMMLFWA